VDEDSNGGIDYSLPNPSETEEKAAKRPVKNDSILPFSAGLFLFSRYESLHKHFLF